MYSPPNEVTGNESDRLARRDVRAGGQKLCSQYFFESLNSCELKLYDGRLGQGSALRTAQHCLPSRERDSISKRNYGKCYVSMQDLWAPINAE